MSAATTLHCLHYNYAYLAWQAGWQAGWQGRPGRQPRPARQVRPPHLAPANWRGTALTPRAG